MIRALGALATCLLVVAVPAQAFRGEPESKSDAERFGLTRPEPPPRARKKKYSPQAVVRLDQLRSRASSVRYSPSGTVAAVTGPIPSRGGSPEEAARGFLSDYREVLEIDPADLRLDERRDLAGETHLLFTQTHAGIPVEFARVKVHLGRSGEVLALHSSHQVDIDLPASPSISSEQAGRSVARELGAAAPEGGALVYLPVPKTGEVRLAWKFKVSGPTAVWQYYVDALTGEVLLRFNDLRFICNSGTRGTVTGEVFDVDPSSSGATPVLRPMSHQKVWNFSTQITTYAVTEADGSFCNSGTSAKIVTALQGPYVNVAHFTKNSAQVDNGGGVWVTAATPVSSPSPYSNGSRFPNSVVYSATLNSTVANAMGAIANFDFFRVGTQTSDGDISDDDQAHVYDSQGNRVASYGGTRLAFHSAPVFGCLSCEQAAQRSPMRIDLQANQSGQELGFRVNVSSYLVLVNQPTVALNPSNVVWSSSFTADGTRDEINIFYHLNLMHDYFTGDVDKLSSALISSGVVAMAHFGPNLGNAFFNPDHNNFGFGDLGGAIALDATVIHHEFTHFVIDKIFPVINFGQNGAISEGVADYFSASSLNVPSIGRFVGSSFGSESALRELACVPDPSPGVKGNPACRKFPEEWVGEIHDDGLAVAQALWEIRTELRSTMSTPAAGQSCADGLVFSALFYFPDSFQELLDALLLVDASGSVQACAGANTRRSTLINKFHDHGITQGNTLFAYEPNDGTQSATDITTLTVITASLYPEADLDYHAFGAGPGRIRATLDLPAATAGSHYAYGMTLVDSKLHTIAEAYPPLNINATLGGACPLTNCQTSSSEVVLEYENATPGLFYLLVGGGLTESGSNSATSSPTPYTLRLQNPSAGAFAGAVVDAKVDNDEIDFTVKVSSFNARPAAPDSGQNFRFKYAQLRDHRLQPIENTRTDVVGGFLTIQNAPVSDNGLIQGSVRLQSAGGQSFTSRYPALGTVYLEVFAQNEMQFGSQQFPLAATISALPQSMGLSRAINLTAPAVNLTAFNNVFNPDKGQLTTLKYEVQSPGRVRVQLFSRSGALVATLFDGVVTAGKGTLDWNGRNFSGQTVASGVYTLRLEGPGGAHETRKVIVVK